MTIDDEPVPLAPGTDDDASSQSSSSSNSSEASEVTIDDEEVPLAPGPGNQGGSSKQHRLVDRGRRSPSSRSRRGSASDRDEEKEGKKRTPSEAF